jgi:hypothetical protein
MKYPILIWMVVVILEMLRHQYLIHKKKISPIKWLSWTARAIVATVILVLWEWRDLAVAVLTYVIVGWWIHDYVPNIMFRRKIWYLNNTGFLDEFQRNYPGMDVWFFWKTLWFFGILAVYFIN